MDDFESEMETQVVLPPDEQNTLPAAESSVAPRGDHPRESIINNDTAALKQILQDPDVKNLVDLFSGTVVDIHR